MTNQKPAPKPVPVVTYSRRGGGSWIETKTASTPLGTVEEIVLSTKPPAGARRTP